MLKKKSKGPELIYASKIITRVKGGPVDSVVRFYQDDYGFQIYVGNDLPIVLNEEQFKDFLLQLLNSYIELLPELKGAEKSYEYASAYKVIDEMIFLYAKYLLKMAK